MSVLNALYSAREGRPVGWGFERLIQVAHCVADGHKDLLRLFRVAMSIYGRAEQIKAEDKEWKWRKKAEAYKPLLAAGSPEYRHDPSHDDLVKFLFPELFDAVSPPPLGVSALAEAPDEVLSAQ